MKTSIRQLRVGTAFLVALECCSHEGLRQDMASTLEAMRQAVQP